MNLVENSGPARTRTEEQGIMSLMFTLHEPAHHFENGIEAPLG